MKANIYNINSTILWPFVAIFLYLTSGTFKALPWINSLPIDITFLGLIIIICAAIVILLENASTFKISYSVITFVLVVAVNYVFSSQSTYSTNKLLMFMLWILIAFCIAVLINNEKNLQSFNMVFPVMAIIVVVLSISTLSTVGSSTTQGYLLQDGRLGLTEEVRASGALGYATAIGFVYFIYRVIYGKGRIYINVFFTLVLALTTVASASRGPIVSIAVCTAFLLLIRFGKNPKHLFMALMLLALSYIAVQTILPTSVLGRIQLSDPIRDYLYTSAMEGFLDRPLFGNGLGSFQQLFPDFEYPHNIFLEIAFELGIVGLIAFVIVLFIAIRNVYSYRQYDSVVIFGGFLLFLLTQSNFSLDLTNKLLWTFLVIATVLPRTAIGHAFPQDRKTSNKVALHTREWR